MLTINDEVLHERVRQNEKWGHQRHDYGTWLTILMEEIGEFCQALQASKGWGKKTDAQNRLTEAIHFIAVGHAIAEQILEEEWRNRRGRGEPL